MITGDSLLIGDAARPDLASEAVEGATGLYGSLQKLLELPDGVELYPGHVAGSLCGAGMSSKASSTIGFERRFNHALNVDQDEFVQERTNSSTPRPPNMDNIVELNRGPFLGAQPPLGTVDSPDGGSVLDVRRAREFVAGHVHGAFNVSFSGSSFATKSAFVLTADEPVAIYASSPEDAETAAQGLRSVGLFELPATSPTPTRARSSTRSRSTTSRACWPTARSRCSTCARSHERDEGYIDGTRHMPYRLVRAFADDLRAEQKPVVTICSTGSRATIAASVLAAAGDRGAPVLGGGVEDWAERGGKTVQFRRCGS